MPAESFLMGIVGFLTFVLLFIGLQRYHLHLGWLSLEIFSGIFTSLLSAAAGYSWVPGFSFWYHISVFTTLWFCFFFVSSIYSVSVSLGIISYLYEQPGKVASLTDIYDNCIVRRFQERADFLVDNGQAQISGQFYEATTAGRQNVRRLRKLHKLLGMTSGGFYSAPPTLIENKDTYL